MGGAICGSELDASKGTAPSGTVHLYQLDPTKGRESFGY